MLWPHLEAGCNMSTKNPDCGCLLPFLSCLCPLNSADVLKKQHSNAIDKKIEKEKKVFEKTLRLLLLGAGESGKSTIIKQMHMIHANTFSKEVRTIWRNKVRNNLVDAIVSILKALPELKPELHLDDEENEEMAKWILENATNKDFHYPHYPREFFEYTKKLWEDSAVQTAFRRSNEFQLIDSAKYFLDRVDVISEDDYTPTEQDILRCRVLTTGIREFSFQVEGVFFRIIDVGGQRDERRKWFLCFNDVTIIIFVAACSSYDSVLREDPNKNRLKESLELFSLVWNNRWLSRISVIIFLNKQDLFREKILSGHTKLEDYFPAYRRFRALELESDEDEEREVSRAKHFIKNEFEQIALTVKQGKQNSARRLFSHFTCAVDTGNIKRVFDDCRRTIILDYLTEYRLI